MDLFVFDEQPAISAVGRIRRASSGRRSVSKPKPSRPRGCLGCPLSRKMGVGTNHGINCVSHAVVGQIRGKPVLILAQAPGKVETYKNLPLIGPAGSLFWKRAAKVIGLQREQCDIDNTVRCRPTKRNDFGNIVDRAPEKEEIFHCSLHTEAQLARATPKVILLLGKVAQQQFLGREYKKDTSVYQSERFKCKVICAPHPSYLLRGAPRDAWEDLDTALQMVGEELAPGSQKIRKVYWMEQDYQRIEDPGELAAFFKELVETRYSVSIDIEDDVNPEGRRVVLCAAFCNRSGRARVVFYDHPQVLRERAEQGTLRNTGLLKQLTRTFLTTSLPKVFWYGVHDVSAFRRLWGVKVHGYDSDAMLCEHQVYPDRADYRLETVAEKRFKRFAGYKHVVDPYLGNPKSFANVPPEPLMYRCCGDADLTLRAYLTTYHRAPKALVKVLVGTSFFLAEMERHGGGLYDFDYAKKLKEIYAPLRQKARNEIALEAGDPNFNPTDDALAWLLKERLELPLTEMTAKGKRVKVGQAILESMLGKHPVIRSILVKKFLDKAESTYIEGYWRSAEFHDGVVTTRWKITGTASGRLASGGDSQRRVQERDRVNLQNIHNDCHIQNLIISSRRWREIASLQV